ncbi:MAG: TetR family transcriptional regulator C-terminal domain-containing protein [Aquisalimonadaceae bacterium]
MANPIAPADKTPKVTRIAQKRRRDLINAAIRNIAVSGYDAVTVATICEEAGFSRGLIGHYFRGKDELLLEAVRAVADELGEVFQSAMEAAGSDPAARLHALIDASFSPPGFTPEKVAVWVALTGTARWSPQLAAIYRDIWRNYRVSVGRLFERAAEAREVEIDSSQIALTFSQMIEGLWVGWAVDPEAVAQEASAACCHAFVRMVLRDNDTGTF